jgi:probable HAF family extracellular repeat protein
MFATVSVHSTMGKGAARWWRVLRLVWVVVAWVAQPSLAQRLTWLDTLDGRGSYALVIFLPPLTRAFGVRPSRWGYASGVSADGSVVVGRAENAIELPRAFRWTAARGMEDLGTLGGSVSVATGVSADGSVVVGRAENAIELPRAFRWTAARGMQDLGTLGSDLSWAWGVSADGSAVVGVAKNAVGHERAFRWTAAGGMEDLNLTYAHLLTNGSELYRANAISPDGGRYIVGQGYNAATGREEAFLLDTQGIGVEWWLTWLGTLGGDKSVATGVSADGSVVVGWAENAEGQPHAFR